LAIAWIASGKNAQIPSVIQAPSTSAAEDGLVETPAWSIPMTDCPAHLFPYQVLFIRSIDESISHDVRCTSSIDGFIG
jgi:hypothetical protein